MKTERRHELETNTLAKELVRWIDRVKPYSKAAAGMLVAAAVVFAVAMFVTRQSSKAEDSAWTAYHRATEGGRPRLDQLKAVADQQRGTSVEPWARIAWADGQLLLGSRLLFYDRNAAKQFLGQAVEAYLELQQSGNREVIQQRATYGLARAYESLSRLDDARQEYGKVDGGFAEIARYRVSLLEEQKSKQFYDWFVEAKLPQPDVSGEGAVPGQKPDFSVGGVDAELDVGDEQASALPTDGGEQPAADGGTSATTPGTDLGTETTPASTESVEASAPGAAAASPAGGATADEQD